MLSGRTYIIESMFFQSAYRRFAREKKDLYLLAYSILKGLLLKYGMTAKKFSEEAMNMIISYDWPGNVRELENVIERAITVCDGSLIYAEHLTMRKSENREKSLKAIIEMDEKRIIEEALVRHHGDRKEVIKELELSKSVFYKKVKKYCIDLNQII